jgi:hypothetical protein
MIYLVEAKNNPLRPTYARLDLDPVSFAFASRISRRWGEISRWSLSMTCTPCNVIYLNAVNICPFSFLNRARPSHPTANIETIAVATHCKIH